MFKKWIEAGKIYADKRMIVMVLLGFSSGFPGALVGSTLSLWLKKMNITNQTIGLFSLIKVPYSFKWLWAPIVDTVRIPLLYKLGRRKSWAIVSQVMLIVFILAMSQVNPLTNLWLLGVFGFFVVIASASQDIVLDAYRVESFDDKEQGAGTAIFILGYRLGMIFSGAGALFLASKLGWNSVYIVMSLGALVGLFTMLFINESSAPRKRKYQGTRKQRLCLFFRNSVVAPFADFLKRTNWKIILLFIFLYKMSDAYMGPMVYPFYDEMGFTEIEIAKISKIFGMGATILGGIIGGLIAMRYNLMTTLLVGGILQGLSNLMFAAQAYVGHDVNFLMLTISVENIAGGIGTAAFVAYLSSLCNPLYTATQYALLSSLMTLLRDVVAASSGFLAVAVSWPVFFIITSLLALPALFLLPFLDKR
ncbi:MAG: MFS transporter [Alphaproteobacteria bacterium]|nr:MFS transporter [Alphaproteobacteria bacterium]